ncbi:DUF5681 domain-containing protein [Kordiimonas aquimaris]|uniref:DUF5681 domain-containing protein n=1 Tax=Kordiimonas aquimaris TaxID=707591 RepID=UPI0021CE2E6B|nr:DUF5681 domain-containing protein [Kordiimonas aquimaris]
MTGKPYDVGRGKPPKQHRFKKGQSGNPKGRPKDKKADEVDVVSLLNKEFTVSEKGKKRKVSAFEAGLQAQVNRALGSGKLADIVDAIRTFEKHGLLQALQPEIKTGVARLRSHPILEDYRLLRDHYEKTGEVLPPEALGGPNQPPPDDPFIYNSDILQGSESDL